MEKNVKNCHKLFAFCINLSYDVMHYALLQFIYQVFIIYYVHLSQQEKSLLVKTDWHFIFTAYTLICDPISQSYYRCAAHR